MTKKNVCKCFYSIVWLWIGVMFLNTTVWAQNSREVTFKYIKRIGPLPACPTTVNNKLLYTELDKDGNKIEIYCNRAYQMKFTRKDGTVGWVGKCPFPWGHNGIAKIVTLKGKLVNGKFKVKAEDYIKPEEFTRTFWKSVNPVGNKPSPTAPGRAGPYGTGDDRLWVYDVKSNKYIRQETKHRGRWVVVKTEADGRKHWAWKVRRQWSDGRPRGPLTPPGTADLLSLHGDAPDYNNLDGHYVSMPEQPTAYTPFPFTAFDEENNAFTYTAKSYYDYGDAEFEEIYATALQEFTFDIEMPHEEEELITYTLVEYPYGMELDPKSGIIYWEPEIDQIGYHSIKIEYTYSNIDTIEEVEFILEAKPPIRETDSGGNNGLIPNYLLYVLGLIIIVYLIFRIRKQKQVEG